MDLKEPVLIVKNVSKSFPGVKALKDAGIVINKGEVHALIGENGAGKSTLMKIILGMYQPDQGEMYYKGAPYIPKSPSFALDNGISMIHQEISLVPTMTVSDNIWIGRESKFGNCVFTNKKKQSEATRNIINRLGLDISPEQRVKSLSIAEMQLVEIARAISYDADIIIMDEPTSALTVTEVDKLYIIIRSLVENGKSIIYISHKLDEIFTICDCVTVMRDGNYIARCNIKDVNEESLVNMMVGREMNDMYPKQDVEIKEVILEVEHLNKSGVVNDVSFNLHKGEILGVAGLMGAGRTEIMQLLFGIDKKDSGTIKLHGKEIMINNTSDAIRHKFAMVTEDRFRSGSIQKHSIKLNESLVYLKSIAKLGFIDKRRELEDTVKMAEKLSVKFSDINGEISLLSGGNQQKVIIGKWLLMDPEILILDEPTRGIDVGAKAEIYKLIGLLAQKGKAIIIISSELPEIMGISDRIIVIKDGKKAGEFARDEFDSNTIMKSAFGV